MHLAVQYSTPSCISRYDTEHPPVILVAIDGLRPDYLDKAQHIPTLQRLHSCGSSAKYLRSIYPTMTFPNHYTLVTVGITKVTVTEVTVGVTRFACIPSLVFYSYSSPLLIYTKYIESFIELIRYR